MNAPIAEIDALRRHAILSALAGFPFLLVFGAVWITAGILSYVVPPGIAPWIYVFLGMPATPIALAIEKRVGYLPAAKPDPLLPLVLQIFFVQIVAFPVIMLVWDLAPYYLPVAFAALVGAHFLPFQWVYQTKLYGVLGVVVAVGPYGLAVFFGKDAMHYTGFFVGATLLVGAFAARAHAKATWRESNPMLVVLLAMATMVGAGFAHPGSAIAVAPDGRVFFVDTGGGVFSIERDGRLVRREGPAFHWFAFDSTSRFASTRWPSIPDSEIRSAGVNPTVILSSDFPVVIGADGAFYYPQGSGGRVQLNRIAPSGARSVRATLPPIRRGGEVITWLNGLAPGPNNSLYYTEDRAVRIVDGRGGVSTLVDAVNIQNCASIPGTETDRPYLRGLAVTPDGTVYVAASGCGSVLKITPRGEVTTILRTSPPWSPTAVAVQGGEVYVLEYLHTASDNRREWLPRVRKISRGGAVVTLATVKAR